MDIVVRGRHAEVSERFREHVNHKLAKVERFDAKCHRVDVEVSKENNPRLADHAIRVEITCHSKGPIIRGEASAAEQYAALDVAYSRLEERLRRAADRRKDRARKAKPLKLTEPAAVEVTPPRPDQASLEPGGEAQVAGVHVEGDGPMVVREKTHLAGAMTLDQALYEMELVGHDFYLFADSANGQPSVVYRRKGYHYGVIRLDVFGEAAGAQADH